MGEGFSSDPAALRDAASNIADILAGTKRGDPTTLCGDASIYGHQELYRAVAEFCEAVNISIELLVNNGEAAGNALHDTARSYTRHDDEAQSAINRCSRPISRP